ncbi:hypothetical protein FACS1894123_03010 [Bacteroidia bacterium]|nr:hypothetical protein FACS1894123_03010 [Bacteroidia bacterium]
MTDNKINLQHLTTILSEKSGLAKKDTESFLREWFDVMGEAITEDGILKVKKLGTFKLTPIEDRESINVASGERVLIPAHNKIIFTPDKELADLVNEPFSWFETVEIESEAPLEESSKPEIVESTEVVEDFKDIKVIEPEPIEETAPVIISNPVSPLKHKSRLHKHQSHKSRSHKRRLRRRMFFFAGILVLTIGVFFFFDGFSNKKRPVLTQITPTPVSAPKPTPESTQDTLPAQKNEPETPKETPIIKESKPAEPAKTTSTPKYRTVANGDRLTLIAQEEYGNKYFWVYIYEENRNIIANPDKIRPGLKLVIPPAQKYGIDKNDEKSVGEAKAISDGFKK